MYVFFRFIDSFTFVSEVSGYYSGEYKDFYTITLLVFCCPDALSKVGASLSGNRCVSPNHI